MLRDDRHAGVGAEVAGAVSVRESVRKACRKRPGLAEPEVLEDFLTGALVRVVREWLEQGMPHSPERMETLLGRMVAGALAGAGTAAGG